VNRPRLLDLFCGAGGATKGYQRAGFHVTGVDIAAQPHYCGDEFHRADALTFPLDGFDVVHASPPCQAYVASRFFNAKLGRRPDHPRLIEPVRERLDATGLLYVIENVPQAPLLNAVTLCGSMFGLRVRRHRRFESNALLLRRTCQHRGQDFVGVFGDSPGGRGWDPKPGGFTDGYARKHRAATIDEAREAMGMDWGDWHGVKEAIPPAYTEFIGAQLLAAIGHKAAS
jgi:DNA (cytosine-5)-methyltransferase 1